MTYKRKAAALIIAAGLFVLAFWSVVAHAAWNAHVIDKETGQPLEGVVVLAVWRKCGFIVMDGCAAYYDSKELVTGPDGRFTLNPPGFSLQPKKGPEFYIFKPGFGQWRFQGQDHWSKDEVTNSKQQKEAFNQFASEKGVIIELTALKTRGARWEFYTSVRFPDVPSEVPAEKMKSYLKVVNDERKFLELDR
ncbi:MAG TPA: hypothetical protein VGH16_09240 [Candidatus Binatia bacterium]|jgi:hypothetical protein